MKLPLSWIKEYLPLTQSPEEIAVALTLAGIEVEEIEKKEGDVVFTLGLTPNLGHCMSLIGIVRELAAVYRLSYQHKKISLVETEEATKNFVTVEVKNKELCHQYSCRLVKQVKIAPSPAWLKNRLEACGLRSVNNVVDISNLVMWEYGEPLHMFDFDKLSHKKIVVKAASREEKIYTLDDQERIIPLGALLICDGETPIAFAGIMGERDSAISDKTTNVLIEAAYFTPETVRKTSKKLNLRTDGSIRWERGVDPLAARKALDRAAELLAEVAGGKICKGVVEVIGQKYLPTSLSLNIKKTNKLLGTELSMGEIASLLHYLEIRVLSESEESLTVQIPSYRNDLKGEIDLIEEVGRMFGINNIPRKIPRHASSMITHSPLFLFEEKTRTQLVAQGLQECLTCDLISPKLAALTKENALNEKAQIHVLHPASIDQSILRPSLLPGLLEMVKYNIDRQTNTIPAFEVGHIHFKEGNKFYSEPAAAIILSGKSSPHHYEHKGREVDFFDLKGQVENLLLSLGMPPAIFEISHLHNFQPGRQAKIKIGDRTIGALGEVHPAHLRELGIEQRVYFAEIHLPDLMQLKKNQLRVTPLPSFPGSERDWTITLRENVPIGLLLDEIQAFASPLLENFYLLDLYKSEKIGKDRKNATFRFQYRDLKKTIEYAEVEKEHQKLLLHLAEKLKDIVL